MERTSEMNCKSSVGVARSMAVLVVGVTLSSVFGCATDDSVDNLLGHWQGTVEEREGHFNAVSPFELTLERRDDGTIVGEWLDRSAALSGNLQNISVTDEGLRAQLSFRARDAEIRLTSADGVEMKVVFESTRISVFGTAARTYPGFSRFQSARVDDAGVGTVNYDYTRPEELGDGWQTSTLGAEGIDEGMIEEMAHEILQESYHLIDSVLIVKNGRLVFEEYFYGTERQHAHEISSATKSLTSMLVGVAVDQGHIESIDQPVYALFPEYRGKRWIDQSYPISIRHLLSMTDGLAWSEEEYPYDDPRNTAGAMISSDDWVGYVLDLSTEVDPGTRYRYNSGASELLGAIIQQATGQRLDEFADENLFKPLGIRNYAWEFGPNDRPQASGSFRMTSRDMAILGQVMLSGGVWQDQRILSESWIDESTKSQTPDSDYTYGYQWHLLPKAGGGITESPVDFYTAAGQGGQLISVSPPLDMVVVVTSRNFEVKQPHPLALILKHILPAALSRPD